MYQSFVIAKSLMYTVNSRVTKSKERKFFTYVGSKRLIYFCLSEVCFVLTLKSNLNGKNSVESIFLVNFNSPQIYVQTIYYLFPLPPRVKTCHSETVFKTNKSKAIILLTSSDNVNAFKIQVAYHEM